MHRVPIILLLIATAAVGFLAAKLVSAIRADQLLTRTRHDNQSTHLNSLRQIGVGDHFPDLVVRCFEEGESYTTSAIAGACEMLVVLDPRCDRCFEFVAELATSARNSGKNYNRFVAISMPAPDSLMERLATALLPVRLFVDVDTLLTISYGVTSSPMLFTLDKNEVISGVSSGWQLKYLVEELSGCYEEAFAK